MSKKMQQLTLFWALCCLFVLMIQPVMIKQIVFKFLFSIQDYLIPLLEQNFLQFFSERVILSAVIVGMIIIVEAVCFFVFGIKLWKKLKGTFIENNYRRFQPIIVLSTLILSCFVLVLIVGNIIHYVVTMPHLIERIGEPSQQAIVSQIETLVKSTELKTLLDLEQTAQSVFQIIRDNSALYIALMLSYQKYQLIFSLYNSWYALMIIGYLLCASISVYDLKIKELLAKRTIISSNEDDIVITGSGTIEEVDTVDTIEDSETIEEAGVNKENETIKGDVM